MADSIIGNLVVLSYSVNTNPSTGRGGILLGHKPLTGNLYHISGVTKSAGVPVSRSVYLALAISPNVIVAKQVTLSDGLFDFRYLIPGEYVVIGVNEDGTQNDVVYANITAVVM